MKPLLLIGGGGHCRSGCDVIEAEGKYKIAGIIEQTGGNSESVFGYQILGNDNDLSELVKECSTALITVGQIKNADLRVRLFQKLQGLGFELATIISPRAYVSKNAILGAGTIVMHDSLINTGAKIGNNCILNTKSLVEHDALVGLPRQQYKRACTVCPSILQVSFVFPLEFVRPLDYEVESWFDITPFLGGWCWCDCSRVPSFVGRL